MYPLGCTWGVPPSLKTLPIHTRTTIYRAFQQITPPKNLHQKGQFLTSIPFFWLFATPPHGMLGQEFCPSSSAFLSLQFVPPPVPPPPIFQLFIAIFPIHPITPINPIQTPCKHHSNMGAIQAHRRAKRPQTKDLPTNKQKEPHA